MNPAVADLEVEDGKFLAPWPEQGGVVVEAARRDRRFGIGVAQGAIGLGGLGHALRAHIVIGMGEAQAILERRREMRLAIGVLVHDQNFLAARRAPAKDVGYIRYARGSVDPEMQEFDASLGKQRREVAARQLDEVRRVVEWEPSSQVFRAGDPVERRVRVVIVPGAGMDIHEVIVSVTAGEIVDWRDHSDMRPALLMTEAIGAVYTRHNACSPVSDGSDASRWKRRALRFGSGSEIVASTAPSQRVSCTTSSPNGVVCGRDTTFT